MTEIKRLRPLAAEAADAAELRKLLAVVVEALDIPYAATMGGDEVRTKVLARRAMSTVVMLREVVAGLPSYATIASQAAHLREQLDAAPARGYVTWETAMDRREAGQDYMLSVTPQTPDEVPDGFEVLACGCGGQGCDKCSGTFIMIAGQSVSDAVGDERQEQAKAEPGHQI